MVARPVQGKLWETRNRIAMLQAGTTVEVRDIESLLGTVTWFFLLSREALAVFRAVYVWVQAERAALRAVLPRD
eukprot:6425229-Alexandrium_andersonii.AAC.1